MTTSANVPPARHSAAPAFAWNEDTMSETPTLHGHAGICDCCVIWLANNEECDCPLYAHPRGLLGRTGDPDDALGSLDLTLTDEREDFSGSPCEGCISWAAGARTRVAVWA